MKNTGQKILIVDDERQNIHILSNILKAEHKIIAARSGEEALNRATIPPPPDLILLDILMPGMDGYAVCQRLKADERTRSIPIMFITSMTEVENEARGLQLGAIDYITKPINPSIVKARVENHLELIRARQEIEQQKRQLEAQNTALLEAVRLRDDVEQITRHDLKAPLQGLIGLPQLILREGNLSEKQIEHLNMIKKASYNMLDMINRSLDLFKMERGIYQLTPVPVDVLGVLRKIAVQTQHLAQLRKTSLKILLHGDEPHDSDTFFVKGEELLYYSMLANLMKNAFEASSEGEQILVTLTEEHETAVIRIHNNGLVPHEIRDRFFEKYVTSGKHWGTGLGTYSAKLIAETQDGRITMTSSQAEGTTLTIRVSMWREASSSTKNSEQPSVRETARASSTIPPDPEPSCAVIPPPPEELAFLQNAVMIGDVMEIRKSITRIERSGAQYAPFISKLRQLTDIFQMGAAREFLEHYRERTE